MISPRRFLSLLSARALCGLAVFVSAGLWGPQPTNAQRSRISRAHRRPGVLGVLRGPTIRRLPGGRRVVAARPGARAGSKAKKVREDPSIRLVVKEYVPRPAAAAPPTPAMPRWRRRYHYRPTQPVYIKSSPRGANLAQVRLGVKVKILGSKSDHVWVRTVGLAEVTGYLPKETVGLRVLRKTSLLATPTAKDAVGEVQGGMLVHVAAKRGAYSKIVLMGQSPLEFWIKSADLGTASATTAAWPHRYPRGHYMSLTAGPVHKSANGRVVSRTTDYSRVYRTTVKGKWAQVAVAAYQYVHFTGWVPSSRVQYGYYGTYYGTGYRQSSYDYSSGSMVAVVKLPVYLALDDAYPTAHISAGARFNVREVDEQWVSVSYSGSVYFSGYMPRRVGMWVPAGTYRYRSYR